MICLINLLSIFIALFSTLLFSAHPTRQRWRQNVRNRRREEEAHIQGFIIIFIDYTPVVVINIQLDKEADCINIGLPSSSTLQPRAKRTPTTSTLHPARTPSTSAYLRPHRHD